jgi:hypothetical protein
LAFPITVYCRLAPFVRVAGFVNEADVSSSRAYAVAPAELVQDTVYVPVEDVAGTITTPGGFGGTIWHPFAPAVHPLVPAAFVALAR